MTIHLIIRPAREEDAPALARVHVDTWRTTYNGIVPDEHLASLSYAKREKIWKEWLARPAEEVTNYAAVTPAGEVVGFAVCGLLRDDIPGFDGELYGLYILKAFQGIGIGRRLVQQAAMDVASRGCSTMVAWVLKDNPSCRFYERLGGQPVAEKTVEIGGKELVEVAYGWRELSELLRPENHPSDLP